MKLNKTYLFITALLVLAFAGGVFVYTEKTSAPTQSATNVVVQIARVTLTIDGLYAAKPLVVQDGQTMLGELQALNAEDPQLQLSTKDYAGMGTLVDGMNGMKNGTDKKYWQYKVNGVMPQIGADQYKLKDGDVVQWFFGASQE